MSAAYAERLGRISGRLPHVAALAAVVAGGLALVGWASGIQVLKAALPGREPMNPVTAVALATAGLAFYLSRSGRPDRSARWGRGLAVAVALIGAAKLGTVAGWEPGFDRLLFRDAAGANRMATTTALLLLLTGLAIALLDARTRRGFWLTQPFALTIAAGSLLAIMGYGLSAEPIENGTARPPMALNTAATFFLLSLGTLCARPGWGASTLLTSGGAGGVMARRLFPVAVLVPIGLGWLRYLGERAGLYSPSFGVALMVVLTVVCVLAALWWTGRRLEDADARRRRMQDELTAAHVNLEERVRARTAELAEVNAALRSQVAERERAEEKVRRLNEDLERRVAELADANRELGQQTRENEMFVYSVSHDLRSPLVNLQGFSKELTAACADLRDIFAGQPLPEAVRKRCLGLIDEDVGESVHFIRTAVTRLSTIIDALLRLSRAGRVEYRPQAVDVRETVQRVVEAMSGTISDRGAAVAIGELPPAWGDDAAVEQVFANLVGNAANYLDPGRPGEIEIGCIADAADGRRTYYVKDNGRGIPAGCEVKVFQAFQRLHPDAAKGEGMGLAIVRRVVERHGGRLWYKSEVGVGTTFFVELPASARPSGGADAARPWGESSGTETRKESERCPVSRW
jgi:signal transduction histidine kinase